MRLIAIFATFVIAGALSGGCDDRDFASLTPADDLGSFEVEATLEVAHGALESRAKRYGLAVYRDPKPRDQAIPSDYFATVSQGRCLLTVEGFRSTTSSRVKV